MLLPLLILVLLPTTTHAQWSPTRRPTHSPTWRPTPAPTVAPLTSDCDLAGYTLAMNGSTNSSCFICRRDFQCAWCIPDDAKQNRPFCFDNRFESCPGMMGSYALDICTYKPLSAGTAAALFALFILLPLICCGACCFAAFKYRGRRSATATVLMPASAVGSSGVAMQPFQQPVQRPYPVASTPGYPGVGRIGQPYPVASTPGYPGGGMGQQQPPPQPATYYYGNAPPPPPPGPQPTYYYSGQPAAGTATSSGYGVEQAYPTTTYGGGNASAPPPPSSPPPYPSAPEYGYGGQPSKGSYM